jgi:hypothetical protein
MGYINFGVQNSSEIFKIWRALGGGIGIFCRFAAISSEERVRIWGVVPPGLARPDRVGTKKKKYLLFVYTKRLK